MFQNLNHKKALISYVVAGHPSLEATQQVVDQLAQNGADMVELGVPFSDAIADGPVIQSASESTAKHIKSIKQTLELAKSLRRGHPTLRLILFSYLNPIYKLGYRPFAKALRESGINAALTVDLPPEEASTYIEALQEQNVGTVFLASPTTSAQRLRIVAEASTEFVYYVSRTGVTGVQSQLSESLQAELKQVCQVVTPKPVAVGFGISTAEQAAQVVSMADGVVVGSAFVKILSTEPDLGSALTQVAHLTCDLRHALDGAL